MKGTPRSGYRITKNYRLSAEKETHPSNCRNYNLK